MTRTNRLTAGLLLAATLAAAGCVQSPQDHSNARNVPAVTIMTFNVENLFDNNDDPGKDDRTYLPLEDKQNDEHRAACAEIEVAHWRDQCLNWDWSDAVIEHKLKVVADAILQVGKGRGPDILALQEVENIAILERLRREYLAAADYRPAILIEGSDLRGIDVAFLSRFETASPPALHPIPFEDIESERVDDTRGILQADFVLPDGTTLTGFAVHFPAPFHPTPMREQAYRQLTRLKNGLPAGRPAFAAGDFNTTSAEDARERMLDRFARPHWIVAHDLGCGDCRGTQYYAPEDSWSFLDMILWSPGDERGKNATWHIRADSVRIANATGAQVDERGVPARFRLPEGSGVSDHWPMVVGIEPEQKQ